MENIREYSGYYWFWSYAPEKKFNLANSTNNNYPGWCNPSVYRRFIQNKIIVLVGLNDIVMYDVDDDAEIHRIPRKIKSSQSKTFTDLTKLKIIDGEYLSVIYRDPNNSITLPVQ